MDRKKAEKFHCTLEATQAIMAGKYKALIIWHLADAGQMRFSHLQRELPQATAKMLSQQLKEMIEDGLVHRKLYPVVPPHTEYRLTELGSTLVPLVHSMCAWGEEYFRHLGIPSPDEREASVAAAQQALKPQKSRGN